MNNFSPRAQKVLVLAREEAERFNHNYIGTEHLLLGLIELGQGVAVTVLQKVGLGLETIRTEVEKQVGLGPEERMSGNIPYTPRLKKVLALAAKDAKAMGHGYVGTEHILIGLLAEDNGVAARVLKTLGLDIFRARAEVLKEHDPNFTSEPNRLTMLHSSPREEREDFKRRARHSAEKLRNEEAKNNFSPRALQVLTLARKEAGRLNHNFVGTDHLLLGVIKLGQGVAVNVMEKLGLNLETLRVEVEKQVGSGPDMPIRSPEIQRLNAEIEDIRSRKEVAIRNQDFDKASTLRDAEKEAKDKLNQVLGGEVLSNNIPFTPRVKTVLALAGEEAKALNHRYIGTEHLLLALMCEDSSATRVLQALGVDLEKARAGVLSELDPNFGLGNRWLPTPDEVKGKLHELHRRVEETMAALKDEGENKPTRQELLKELEDILATLDSLKTGIVRLRADVLKRKS